MKIVCGDCGNTFLGWEDKEDTCPECLKKLIDGGEKNAE